MQNVKAGWLISLVEEHAIPGAVYRRRPIAQGPDQFLVGNESSGIEVHKADSYMRENVKK